MQDFIPDTNNREYWVQQVTGGGRSSEIDHRRRKYCLNVRKRSLYPRSLEFGPENCKIGVQNFKEWKHFWP